MRILEASAQSGRRGTGNWEGKEERRECKERKTREEGEKISEKRRDVKGRIREWKEGEEDRKGGRVERISWRDVRLEREREEIDTKKRIPKEKKNHKSE